MYKQISIKRGLGSCFQLSQSKHLLHVNRGGMGSMDGGAFSMDAGFIHG